jgi:hypothetical protein
MTSELQHYLELSLGLLSQTMHYTIISYIIFIVGILSLWIRLPIDTQRYLGLIPVLYTCNPPHVSKKVVIEEELERKKRSQVYSKSLWCVQDVESPSRLLQ